MKKGKRQNGASRAQRISPGRFRTVQRIPLDTVALAFYSSLMIHGSQLKYCASHGYPNHLDQQDQESGRAQSRPKSNVLKL